jgi:hypothetical protein
VKGTVVVCLQQLVVAKFGEGAWHEALETAGIEPTTIIMPLGDYEDATVLGLIDAVCSVTGLTKTQALEAYGEHWVTVYGKRMYSQYYRGCGSARDFFEKLADIHLSVTRTIENARPPDFETEWKGERCLHLHYRSHRDLMDLAIPMARGVGKHFGELLLVRKVGQGTLEIRFP